MECDERMGSQNVMRGDGGQNVMRGYVVLEWNVIR